MDDLSFEQKCIFADLLELQSQTKNTDGAQRFKNLSEKILIQLIKKYPKESALNIAVNIVVLGN